MNELRPALCVMRSLAFRLKVILTALTVFHVLSWHRAGRGRNLRRGLVHSK